MPRAGEGGQQAAQACQGIAAGLLARGISQRVHHQHKQPGSAWKACPPVGAHALAARAVPRWPHWQGCKTPSARPASNGAPAAGRWQTPSAPPRRCRCCCLPPLPLAAGWPPPRCPPELSQHPRPAGRGGARGLGPPCRGAAAHAAARSALQAAGRAAAAPPARVQGRRCATHQQGIGVGGPCQVGGRLLDVHCRPRLGRLPAQLLERLQVPAVCDARCVWCRWGCAGGVSGWLCPSALVFPDTLSC